MPKSIRTSAAQLRTELKTAGLTADAVAAIFRASPRSARAWVSGKRPVPPWLVPALRIYQLLTPAARGSALPVLLAARPAKSGGATPARAQPAAPRHPFARIEEL